MISSSPNPLRPTVAATTKRQFSVRTASGKYGTPPNAESALDRRQPQAEEF